MSEATKGNKYIYPFREGRADMKDLLGGKGANLAEMLRIGLPVPPGFTITTEACLEFLEKQDPFIDELWPGVKEAVREIEKETGKTFGGTKNPLLVSVRSGAAISMPGMMDTILNLGLNDETVEVLAAEAEDERFAYDSYRRFIQMYADVVLGIESSMMDNVITQTKRSLDLEYDYEVPADAWKKVIEKFKRIVSQENDEPFPTDPWDQLKKAIVAVFNSWNTPRAKTYRKINHIPDDLGTAVNVVTMVFGNLGDDCGTGVCFTRNPATGEKILYGEFLTNAQGEDVVAGIRNPKPIAALAEEMPEAHRELEEVASLLEKHYKDMQDIEFTIEKKKLYILQTRTAKRTAKAAVNTAMDMYNEKLIDGGEAVSRVTPDQVEQLLHKQIDPEADYDVLAKGLPASPGAAVGEVVFDADEAERLGQSGDAVILVRPETTPDDIHGLFAAQGVLTSRGGMTSHAAVVARGIGKPCVSGCEAVQIDLDAGEMRVKDTVLKKGDIITIDGTKGEVIVGKVPLVQPSFSEEFRELLNVADGISDLEVWANADTPEDSRKAREFGAKGIGLCRTEHMFMATERLPVMQEMIMSGNREEREQALDKLRVMQKEDFMGIFEAMEGLPVTIRLLDPPLHEFLPNEEELREKMSELEKEGKKDSPEYEKARATLKRALALRENNPMLGFRGCRLGMIYPEIYEMQIRAILETACELAAKGKKVIPDIMMPLVGTREEMKRLKEMVDKVAAETMEKAEKPVDYLVGTMIELPRAALVADKIAEYAEFFSFGTNDLTQTTFGYSRDDAEGKFLAQYVTNHILDENPFHVLDREGVGRLMEIAVNDGRSARRDIQIGICGEHGGNPRSIAFCHKLKLKYVSCSPYRVPVARLSAAQAKLGLID